MFSFMLKGTEKLLNGSEECGALFLHLRKYYELRYILLVYNRQDWAMSWAVYVWEKIIIFS